MKFQHEEGQHHGYRSRKNRLITCRGYCPTCSITIMSQHRFKTITIIRIKKKKKERTTYRKKKIQSIPGCMTNSSSGIHWTTGRSKAIQTRLQPCTCRHSQFHPCINQSANVCQRLEKFILIRDEIVIPWRTLICER